MEELSFRGFALLACWSLFTFSIGVLVSWAVHRWRLGGVLLNLRERRVSTDTARKLAASEGMKSYYLGAHDGLCTAIEIVKKEKGEV